MKLRSKIIFLLELIACDINSNIVCFNTDGEELWEQRISGYPNQPPSVGDINGDGVLDLVVGTTEGHIWAVYVTINSKRIS